MYIERTLNSISSESIFGVFLDIIYKKRNRKKRKYYVRHDWMLKDRSFGVNTICKVT